MESLSFYQAFPSPYWGLFFIAEGEEDDLYWCDVDVSVPALGINFLSLEDFKILMTITEDAVSVPALGIIFLSLPSIIMITSAPKLRLSAESLQRYP